MRSGDQDRSQPLSAGSNLVPCQQMGWPDVTWINVEEKAL
jgi:hypothetical protein